MFQEVRTILAVNPGTKYLGLAVFQDTDLVYWGVKVRKGKWSKQKAQNTEKTLLALIDRYRVNTLVLKNLHPSRSSKNLDQLVGSIKNLAKTNDIRLHLCSLDDIKKGMAVKGRINKMAIAEIVTARYLFLVHELESERKHRNPYFVRMFEAVAAGITTFIRMDQKQKTKQDLGKRS
jgi:hypothetical protein